ncbi:protein of unknown function [Methylacidimicrobium sp. AP8]|nr:protein of unknown function [Methylacidimicrobium sp. AP8]
MFGSNSRINRLRFDSLAGMLFFRYGDGISPALFF